MNQNLVREIITGAIGALVLGGCGVLIFLGRGSEDQAWLAVGIVLMYFFNRAQQAGTVNEVLRSQPTLTATGVERAEVTAQPGVPD